MALGFSNLTPKVAQNFNVDTIITGDKLSVEFDSPTANYHIYVNNVYQKTSLTALSRINISDDYSLDGSSTNTSSFQDGQTYNIKVQDGTSGAPSDFDATVGDFSEWHVDVVDVVEDNATPSYTSTDVSINLYGADPLTPSNDWMKLFNFDPSVVTTVIVDLAYVSGSSSIITETMSSDPHCLKLGSADGDQVATINSVKVEINGVEETITELSGLDFAGDATIQANEWPGECVPYTGNDTPDEPTEGEIANTLAEELNRILEGIAGSLSSISTDMSTLTDAATDPEQGIYTRPVPSEEWAFSRAAMINAVREAQQLENVYGEMVQPTKYPDAGYRSEEELNAKPDTFFRPSEDNFDPSYEDRSCPFDPIPPEELTTGEEDNEDTPNEGDDENNCHPDFI